MLVKRKLTLMRPIVIVGMMGAGKSAIGLALSRRLEVPFRDSDAEIEAAADRTISEIFERDGEDFFRARESEVIQRLLGEGPAILSTGGGAFLRAENREAIARNGVSVWLRADLDLLWSRVRHKDTRPLLRTPDPRATLAALLEARTPHYQRADLAIESAPELSIEAMTDRVIGALKRADLIKES